MVLSAGLDICQHCSIVLLHLHGALKGFELMLPDHLSQALSTSLCITRLSDIHIWQGSIGETSSGNISKDQTCLHVIYKNFDADIE